MSIPAFAGTVADLARLKDFKAKRESSWDRTGGNRDAIPIDPATTATLADIPGCGIISHIWFTISCEDQFYLRKLLLKMYWDGEAEPSVEVPVGDFFGVGHAKRSAYQCAVLNMSSGEGEYGGGTAMNCYFPMPFSNGARIQIANECQVPVRSFYYYIDYQEHKSLDDLGRFHAQWRRENPCQAVDFKGQPEINLTGDENYVIMGAKGKGHYVGCNISIHNLSEGWWGEGDDMIFVDGEEWPPSCHGTGTEDYFCHAWGMQDQRYLYHGTSLYSHPNQNWKSKWTVYRYHIVDPVPFEKSIRVTIEHGHANDRGDDYSSVGYWYQTEPHLTFPPMLPTAQRLPRLEE